MHSQQRRRAADRAPLGPDDQRQAAEEVRAALRSPGRPLEPRIRAQMERAFGEDLSGVRIHSDRRAERSAWLLGAGAYTAGEHIVLAREDLPALEGAAGRRLLAHELAHVLQQRRGPVEGSLLAAGVRLSRPGDRFERAAELFAERIGAAGSSASVDETGTAVGGAGSAGGGIRAGTSAAAPAGELAVQPVPFGKYLTPSYYRRRRALKHSRVIQTEVDEHAGRAENTFMRSNPATVQGGHGELSEEGKLDKASRQFANRLLAPVRRRVRRTAERVTRTSPSVGDQQMRELVDALVPVMFPPDAGYIKGGLAQFLTHAVSAVNDARWSSDQATENAERTVVLAIVFLRGLTPVLVDLATDPGTGAQERSVLLRTSQVMQALANLQPSFTDARKDAIDAHMDSARAFYAAALRRVGGVDWTARQAQIRNRQWAA